MISAKLYRLLGAFLLLNNLAGISLNLELTILACILYGLGFPGIIFTFMYAQWAFLPRSEDRSNYALNSIIMIIYNAFVFYLVKTMDLEHETDLYTSFYPDVFPLINVILCSTLLLISQAKQGNPEKLMKESTKNTIAIFSGLIILMIILLFIFIGA